MGLVAQLGAKWNGGICVAPERRRWDLRVQQLEDGETSEEPFCDVAMQATSACAAADIPRQP
jgi:hypothetical protein